MRRDCTERCRPGCMESGYGIFSRTCTRCCQTTFCNNFDGRKFLLNDLDVQQLGGIYANKTINITKTNGETMPKLNIFLFLFILLLKNLAVSENLTI
ncbi:hypothetical protein ACQ4LE_009219 [Meloidogyne hapla]